MARRTGNYEYFAEPGYRGRHLDISCDTENRESEALTTVPALHLALGPSWILAAILAIAHGASLLVLWWSGLAAPFALILTLVVSAHGFWAIRRFALLRSRKSFVALTLDRELNCTLTARHGVTEQGTVVAQTTVTGRMVIIVARVGGDRGLPVARHIAIFADTLEPAGFRAIRVLLRWARPQTWAVSHS